MTNVVIKWELIHFKHNMDNKKTYEIWLAFYPIMLKAVWVKLNCHRWIDYFEKYRKN